jgi:hypothetical protein
LVAAAEFNSDYYRLVGPELAHSAAIVNSGYINYPDEFRNGQPMKFWVMEMQTAERSGMTTGPHPKQIGAESKFGRRN